MMKGFGALRVFAYLNSLPPDRLATVTRDEIARTIGMHPSNVSRGMRTLQDLGRIEVTYKPAPGGGPGRWWNITLLDD